MALPPDPDFLAWPSASPSLILSATTDPQLPYSLPPTLLSNALTIYAEYLQLNLSAGQTISSPGNDLNLYAGSFSIADTLSLDVTGSAGAQGTIAAGINANPTASTNGTKGGNLTLYTENVDFNSVSTLHIFARGGSGGRGQNAPSGIPAPGANGSDGGQVNVLVGTFMGYLVDQFVSLFSNPPPATTPIYTYGGVPGLAFLQSVSAFLTPYANFAATSSVRSKFNAVTVSHPVGYDQVAQTPRLLARLQALNGYVLGLISKPPTANDPQLDSKLAAFEMHLNSICQTFATTLFSHTNVLGGYPGAGGTGFSFDKNATGQQQISGNYVKASSGVGGKTGQVSTGVRYNSSKGCLGKWKLLPAHPDQCNMLLAQAKTAYFLKQGDVAGALFQKLKSKLSFLDWITPADPIYQTYVAKQSLFHMDTLAQVSGSSASSSNSGTKAPPRSFGVGSLDALQDIYTSADVLYKQMVGGLDYVGHVFGWVPRASYASYIDLCTTLLDNLFTLEKAYTAYTAADATQAAMQQSFMDSWNTSSGAIDVAKAQIAELDQDISSTANTLSTLRPQVVAAKALLDSLWADVKETVESSFSVSMSKMISVAGMCAMAPESPMPLVGALDLYNTADKDVTDDSDNTVTKDYLVGRIEQVQATEDALDEGYTQRQDGGLDVDDPRATKLIASENDMMALLSKYSNLLGTNNLDTIKNAYDAYIGLVTRQNNLAIHYTACATLYFKAQHDISFYEGKEQEITSNLIKNYDPELPAIRMHMQRLYTDALGNVMKTMYMAQRAYSYAAVTKRDPIFETFASQGSKGLPQLRAEDLKAAMANLQQAYEQDYREFQHGEKLPLNKVRYDLPSLQVSQLKLAKGADRRTWLTISANTDPTITTNPFADMCNVRLTSVRLFVEGAKLTDPNGILHIDIQHTGTEYINDETGFPLSFTHDGYRTQFRYKLADKSYGPSVPGTSDGIIGVVDGDRALLGPFTTWKIDILQSMNPGLDLSGITGLWVEFEGFYEPLGAPS